MWFKSRASQEALMAQQIQILRDCRKAIESLTYKVAVLKSEVAELKRKIQPHSSRMPEPGYSDPRSKYVMPIGYPTNAMTSVPPAAPMSRDVHPAPTSGMDPLLAGALGYVLGSSGPSESHHCQQQDDTPTIVSGGGGDFSGGGASGCCGSSD